ncbi:hypothetical protein V3C99_013805 [Haemonchus contortus]|uniref:Uncharacterized protein n=1 Tax=Haemonchus contortus TaxID=6289 RepID=A0A7I4YS85_HAECO|nr:unnamed protein product [Haemonchus contortus]
MLGKVTLAQTDEDKGQGFGSLMGGLIKENRRGPANDLGLTTFEQLLQEVNQGLGLPPINSADHQVHFDASLSSYGQRQGNTDGLVTIDKWPPSGNQGGLGLSQIFRLGEPQPNYDVSRKNSETPQSNPAGFVAAKRWRKGGDEQAFDELPNGASVDFAHLQKKPLHKRKVNKRAFDGAGSHRETGNFRDRLQRIII